MVTAVGFTRFCAEKKTDRHLNHNHLETRYVVREECLAESCKPSFLYFSPSLKCLDSFSFDLRLRCSCAVVFKSACFLSQTQLFVVRDALWRLFLLIPLPMEQQQLDKKAAVGNSKPRSSQKTLPQRKLQVV